ncbi:MAG: hypothetical protein H6515_08625 [Microthrixaceae bacterium]|nr:hypothetical protein [Microthrixaceae bacterium]
MSHVPGADGRDHLLVFGLPHIGMDPAGRLGQSLRRFTRTDPPRPAVRN